MAYNTVTASSVSDPSPFSWNSGLEVAGLGHFTGRPSHCREERDWFKLFIVSSSEREKGGLCSEWKGTPRTSSHCGRVQHRLTPAHIPVSAETHSESIMAHKGMQWCKHKTSSETLRCRSQGSKPAAGTKTEILYRSGAGTLCTPPHSTRRNKASRFQQDQIQRVTYQTYRRFGFGYKNSESVAYPRVITL